MADILDVAPTGNAVTAYDRKHLALYAALIEAADADVGWKDVAATIMKLDPSQPEVAACWQSHLDRARWLVGPGLALAMETFSQPAV